LTFRVIRQPPKLSPMSRTAFDILRECAIALGFTPRADVAARGPGLTHGGVGPSEDQGPAGTDLPERAPPFETFDLGKVLQTLEERLAVAEAELESAGQRGDHEGAAYRRLKVEALRGDIRTLRHASSTPVRTPNVPREA
jgi:hypothetical protein